MTNKNIQIKPFVQFMKYCGKQFALEINNSFPVIKIYIYILSSSDFYSSSLPHTYKKSAVFLELQKTLGIIFLPAAHEHKTHGAKFLFIAILAAE